MWELSGHNGDRNKGLGLLGHNMGEELEMKALRNKVLGLKDRKMAQLGWVQRKELE